MNADPLHWLVLAAAALGAGLLNALAGGGSFLTFPALVWTGVPPIAANATSAVAVSPGYLGSSLGFADELRALPRQRLRREMLIAAVGGVLGALLLLITPAKVFAGVVPWLLLLATVLFALGPTLAQRARQRQTVEVPAHSASLGRSLGLLAVAIYGGYFNGGLGILLMALYTLTGETRIHTVNALKNLNSLVLSLLSVATFAWAGVVVWREAALMALAATLGGWLGARLAQRLPAAGVRLFVIATGLVMSGLFFARNA